VKSVPKGARVGRGNGIPGHLDTNSESESWDVVFRGTAETEWGRRAGGAEARAGEKENEQSTIAINLPIGPKR
jgi:hypothetical protein